MCYTISLLNPAYYEHYDSLITFDEPYETEPVYYRNAFSLPYHPVIPNTQPYRIQEYVWGLIPFWVKNLQDAEKIRLQTMNARADTIFEKPSFRSAIIQRRCLIPADGFFEWRYYNGKNYPYYIHLKNHEVFSIAGIWDMWTNPDTKEEIFSFSLITCKANPLLEKIHNKKKRMPVILLKEVEEEYLRNTLKKDDIHEMLSPINDEYLEAHTISKRVTSKTNDRNVLSVIEPFDYPELPSI